MRTVVRGAGKTLIAAGTLILLFVAYELWGTNLAEAKSQRSLKRDFLASLPTTTTTPTTSGPAVGPAPTAPPDTAPPPPPSGEAVAIIKIPRIGVEKAVVEGVGVPDLKKGPGHYPNTPMPGQPGNAAIAGHRTTYGAPFNRIDELQPGDPVFVTTRQGRFRYEVTGQEVVRPTDTEVLKPAADNRLTLTTCNPKFSARQRLIVTARLVGEAAVAPPPTAPPPPSSATPGVTTIPGDPAPAVATPEVSGDDAAVPPAIGWGVLCALVAAGGWFLGRRWRRWPAYLLATPVFLVMLFFFFENFARLLPANI